MGALAEIRRVLKRDGLFLLRVPAHDWLRGEHDRLVHTRHRYGWEEIRGKLEDAGFAVDQLTWANTVLFLPAVAKRLSEGFALRVAKHPLWVARCALSAAAPEPDLWMPPPALNAVLESVIAIEGVAIPRGVQLPFGLSLLAVARAV
jgi:hypothetical protein